MIVDANVLVSAIIGRSLALLRTVQAVGFDLLVPAPQFREAELNGFRLAKSKNLDALTLVQRVLDLVQPVDGLVYGELEGTARSRLDKAEKAQRDWPLLALALTTGDAIWTNDPDLFGAGVATWKTINIHQARPTSRWAEEN